MNSGKKASVSIPEYQKPTPPSFNLYGLEAKYGNGGYSLNEDPLQKSDRLMAEGIRRELLSSLGLNSGTKEDPYAQLLQQETLRTAQPQLENALIQRGLGGSSVYRDALTDLINKASVSSALESNNMKLANLNAVQNGYLLPQYEIGRNLLGMSSDAGYRDAALAAQIYQMQLPYLAMYNQPGNNGLMGALQGAGTGFMLGGPVGAGIGAGAGYLSTKSGPSTQSLYSYQLEQEAKKNQGLGLQDLAALKNLGAF